MATETGPDVVVSQSRVTVHQHKGITLPSHVLPEMVEDLQSFKFRPDDILIVTSPKSGELRVMSQRSYVDCIVKETVWSRPEKVDHLAYKN